jgi:uncharacterized damage-inducible protein DinB
MPPHRDVWHRATPLDLLTDRISVVAGPLRQTLDEEERMAAWMEEHLREVTQRFLQLTEQGAKADR